ncbi:MAG: hypothetical protein AVDCRST_MAG87-3820, partial [uncultured Thermomicrobiales bacterium]
CSWQSIPFCSSTTTPTCWPSRSSPCATSPYSAHRS